MTVYVLHIAPFDPGGYPPLINTVHVCAAAGLRSVVIASAPVAHPEVLGDARIIAPSAPRGGGAQQAFLAQCAAEVVRDAAPVLIIGHNVRSLPVAAAASLLGRAPFVYHCHDFEALTSLKDRVFWASELTASRAAVETWVPAPERVAMARERHLSGQVVVVRNCPRRVDQLPPRGRLRAWLAERGARGAGQGRIITRHGKIGAAHCIRETIEAMALLPEDVVFVIIGDGDREYIRACEALAEQLGLDGRVFFHPFVPHSALMELLVDGDVGMGLYAPVDLNCMTPAPNKVFENMALGVPVVVATGNSVADDVLAAQAGLAVPVGSKEALANALSRLVARDDEFARARRAAARAAHLGTFNYEVQLGATALGARFKEGLSS